MVNAWSLAASILDGTFDKDYPIMTDIKINTGVGNTVTYSVPLGDNNLDEDITIRTESDPVEHSTSWYDYNRNDPLAENPFTDAFDHLMAESVTGKDPYIYESPDGGTTITRRKPGDDYTQKEVIQGDYFGSQYPYVGNGNTASDTHQSLQHSQIMMIKLHTMQHLMKS